MVTLPRLHLKLLRDVKAARVQFGAVAFIILLGISIFICAYEAYRNLDISYSVSFNVLNMGDYWISVDEVDSQAVRKINKIDGVKAVGRIIGDVFIDLKEDSGEKIVGRVLSLPPHGFPILNALRIESGNYISSGMRREVLVEKHFADYHQFKPGDEITVERDGKRARFTISGIVVSPEHIWVVKSAQEPMPSPRTFGIIFMNQSMVEDLFDMKGSVNEIVIAVSEGIDHDEVITEVKNILSQHFVKRITSEDDPVTVRTRKIDIVKGVRAGTLVKREDLPTIQMLRQDMESFAMLAYFFPLLFLSMASLAIYVLLSRLIESQRIQIGLMTAIGYSKSAILFHYAGFALMVGIIGSVLGVVVGHILANGLTDIYVQQLNIPYTVVQVHWDVLAIGVVIGIVVPVLAGLIPALSTLGIHPAEAMRPTSPSSGNRIVMKALAFLFKRVSYILKLPVRNVFRNIRRSLFMSMGVASAVILVLVAMSFVDAMQNSMDMQFNVIQRYDAFVHFQGRTAVSTVAYVRNLDGIASAEAIMELPYRMVNGNRKVDTSILGLPEGSSMFTLQTPEGTRVDVASDGILVPFSLKNKLGAEIGDRIILEPLTGTVGQVEKTLAGYIFTYLGGRVYMPLQEAQRMVRDPGSTTGILLKFNGQPSSELLKRLYRVPQVASVELVEDTLKLMDEMMGFFWVMITIMLLMGCALGIAIIFNGVTVNVLQRKREVATMRAVGLSDSALTAIISIENWIIGCIGVLIGIPMGYYIADLFMKQMSTSAEDIVSINLVIFPRSYAIAIVAALIVLIISQIPAIRSISRQNLATVTKEWNE
jgi:putative ABC transport system permease protein